MENLSRRSGAKPDEQFNAATCRGVAKPEANPEAVFQPRRGDIIVEI